MQIVKGATMYLFSIASFSSIKFKVFSKQTYLYFSIEKGKLTIDLFQDLITPYVTLLLILISQLQNKWHYMIKSFLLLNCFCTLLILAYVFF